MSKQFKKFRSPKMSKEKESSNEYCGLCGRRLSTSSKNVYSLFTKKCQCCGTEYPNHPKCSTKYANSTSRQISASDFNKCILPYRCHKCKVTCFVCNKKHENVNGAKAIHCNNCKKVWTILAPKCLSKNKLLCTNCQCPSKSTIASDKPLTKPPSKLPASHINVQSSSPSSPSKTQDKSSEIIDLHTLPVASIKRFNRHKNPNQTFIGTVPYGTIKTIKETISDAFTLDNQNDEFEFFRNLDDAKLFFNRKLGYVRDSSLNIFQFITPTSIADQVNDPFVENSTFFLSLDDIASLYNNKKPTINVIDFVVDCLNFYSVYTHNTVQVPEFIFGFTDDLDFIMPTKNNYGLLFEYFHSQMRSPSTPKKQIDLTLKHWYAKHDKDHVTNILDKYTARGHMISNYVVMSSNCDGTYSLYHVVIPEYYKSIKDSEVTTLDLSNGHPIHVKKKAIWLSKFFGLYLKEMSEYDFTDKDFNGRDIFDSLLNVEDDSFIDEDSSIFRITKLDTDDDVEINKENDGLYYLGVITAMIRGKDYFTVVGVNQNDRDLFANEFRLMLLQMIANMYEVMHDSTYRKVSKHLFLSEGDPFDEVIMSKWRMVHGLCDKSVYEVNLKKGRSANYYLQRKTDFQVDNDWKKNMKKKESGPKNPLTEEQKLERKQKRDENKKQFSSLQPLWLIDKPNTRTQNILFMSDKRVVTIATDSLGINFSDLPDDAIKTPNDIVTDITDIFVTNYGYADDSGNSIYTTAKEQFVKDIKDHMLRHEIYFIMEADHNQNQQLRFDVVAAMIVEEEIIFQNTESCAIIHAIAAKKKYNTTHHLKSILFEVFNQDHMKLQQCVYLNQFGHDKVVNSNDRVDKTYMDLFSDMKFHLQDCIEIANDIRIGSSTMVGNGSDIKNYCETTRMNTISSFSSTHRIGHINNANTVEYKFEDGDVMVYSHPFHWNKALNMHLDRLTSQKKKIMKKNPGTAYPFGGQGSRQEHHDKSLATFDKQFPVPYTQSQAMLTENNCVWLSTACLVNQVEPLDCNEMIYLFNNSESNFEWMHIMEPKNEKLKQVFIESGDETLSQKMQRDVGYNVTRVKKKINKHCYIDQLMAVDTKGKYVVELQYNNTARTHVVGIDCDYDLIWDSTEQYAMELTIKNLNYCAGKKGAKIECIPHCYKVLNNNKKRRYRHIEDKQIDQHDNKRSKH